MIGQYERKRLNNIIWKRTWEENDRTVQNSEEAERVVTQLRQYRRSTGLLFLQNCSRRDRSVKDMPDAEGEVPMTDEIYIKERWRQYYNWLLNEENLRIGTEERYINLTIVRDNTKHL